MFLQAPINYPIINLNQDNTILFITLFKRDNRNITTTVGTSQILSKNITSLISIENLKNIYGQLSFEAQDSLDRLNCFIKEKRLIECVYVESNFYTVAIFEENFNYYNNNIILDNQSISSPNNEEDFSQSFRCMHLKEEIGV